MVFKKEEDYGINKHDYKKNLKKNYDHPLSINKTILKKINNNNNIENEKDTSFIEIKNIRTNSQNNKINHSRNSSALDSINNSMNKDSGRTNENLSQINKSNRTIRTNDDQENKNENIEISNKPNNLLNLKNKISNKENDKENTETVIDHNKVNYPFKMTKYQGISYIKNNQLIENPIRKKSNLNIDYRFYI